MRSNYLFHIGLNKAGSTSVAKACELLGIKTIHMGHPKHHERREHLLSQMRNYALPFEKYEPIQAWFDVPAFWNHFHLLDVMYPDAKFIFTTRDLDSWLNSREKHVRREWMLNASDPNYPERWSVIDREKWTNEWWYQHQMSVDHFSGRRFSLSTNKDGKFFMFDITKHGWSELAKFLQVSEHSIPKDLPFPYLNKAPLTP